MEIWCWKLQIGTIWTPKESYNLTETWKIEYDFGSSVFWQYYIAIDCNWVAFLLNEEELEDNKLGYLASSMYNWPHPRRLLKLVGSQLRGCLDHFYCWIRLLNCHLFKCRTGFFYLYHLVSFNDISNKGLEERIGQTEGKEACFEKWIKQLWNCWNLKWSNYYYGHGPFEAPLTSLHVKC